MKKDLSLYIHIPFCKSKCFYCNFVSKVANDQEKLRYVEALIKEIKIRAKEYNSFYTISTIYIGGGTPSCLPKGAIKNILSTIYKNFTVKNTAEITMEMNPNTISSELVNEYVLSGVNRFSIGFQCMSSDVLKSMGRTHSVIDFENAIKIIRGEGIQNISADLIIGYPNQTQEDVLCSAKYLESLKIPHISSYMLSVEKGTPLEKMIDNGEKFLPNEESVIKTYQSLVNFLSDKGYKRYEISNFAKPGYECKHNNVYWKRGEYLGLGCNSHSLIDQTRFSNTENITEYIEHLETSTTAPVAEVTKLSIEEEKEEFIMLSLRTNEGLNTAEYEKEFGENFLEIHNKTLVSFVKDGFLSIDKQGNVKATSKGFLVLNKIILELCS